MAYTKVFLFAGLLFAVVLAITSEVSARELSAETQDVVDDGHWGGGHGHGGHGGHGGHRGHGGRPEDKTDDVVEDGRYGHYGGGHGRHYGGGHYGGGHHGGGGGHGGYPEVKN